MAESKSNIEQIRELIPIGGEHPITAKKISEVTNISLREVYAVIRYLLVNSHVPIGATREASNPGYYIITNEEERQATLAPLVSHANEIEERIKVIKHINLKDEAI